MTDAEAQWKLALQNDPGFVTGWLSLAELFENQGRLADAEGALRQAIEGAPNNAALRTRLDELRRR